MNALKYALFIAWIVFGCSAHASNGVDPFVDFRNGLATYNSSLYDRNFTNNDALEWWALEDRFILSVFNSLKTGQSIKDFFAPYNGKTFKGLDIAVYDDKNRGYEIDIGLSILRPSSNERQNFGIQIRPLNGDDSVFFVDYRCVWREIPRSKGPSSLIGTFRILEKDARYSKYRITARNEETIFFKQFVIPGKLRHGRSEAIPPYRWGGVLAEGSILNSKSGIVFDVICSLCPTQEPCYHDITVTYIYRGCKLLAKKYHEYDERHGYDRKNAKYIPKDVTVNLVP